MKNIRELTATAAVGGNLSDHPTEETPLDRIGALAFSDRLGGLLWRLKWAGDRRCLGPAVALLAKRSTKNHDRKDTMLKVCVVVIQEWLNDNCKRCGGRKYLMATAAAPKHVCTACNGTGRARYSLFARARAMGWTEKVAARWERRFEAIHQRVGDADIQAWRDVSLQLGRRTKKLLTSDLVRTMIQIQELDVRAPNNNSMPELTSTATLA